MSYTPKVFDIAIFCMALIVLMETIKHRSKTMAGE